MHILAVPSRSILTAVSGAFGRLQGSTGGFLGTTASFHDSIAVLRPAAHPKEIAATRKTDGSIVHSTKCNHLLLKENHEFRQVSAATLDRIRYRML
jgi:hypothetical protein